MGYVEKYYDNQRKLEDDAKGGRWNGRQIRNAFQSPIAPAVYEAKDKSEIKFEVRNFKKVAEVAAQFDDYLFQTHNKRSHEDIAQSEFLRAPLDM
jgi:hypothetical protein